MSLNVEHRVDILIKEGVDKPKKWATVHGYVEPEIPVMFEGCAECGWYQEWTRLRAHHLDETKFLFDVIRELVKRCNAHTSKTD
jgi:hypothetical protein